MRYLHGKIKANKGGKITVTISKKTRVLILTEKDFKRYKNNQTYTYFGGVKEGSYDFTAIKSGVWHVVVEKGSYHKPENIKASFSLEKVAGAERKSPKKLASTLQEADELVNHDTSNEGEQEEVEKEQ
jgi:hypothetical protein